MSGCATDYGLLRESIADVTSIGIIHEPQQTSAYNLSTSAMEVVDIETLPTDFPDAFQDLCDMALPILQSAFPEKEIKVLDPNPIIPDDPEDPGYNGEIDFSGIDTDVVFVISYYGFYEDHDKLVVKGSWDNKEWVAHFYLEFHGVYYLVHTQSRETIGGLNGYYQMKPMSTGDTEDIYSLDWSDYHHDVMVYMENELHEFLGNIKAGD